MILADWDTATIKARLSEAREAYHKLVSGQMVAEVRDQNGENVRYSRADIDRLDRWIRTLEFALAERGEAAPVAGYANVWMGMR